MERDRILTPQEALNLHHANNPEVGDYWHEMYAPMFIVLAVDNTSIICGASTIPSGPDCWTWDVAKTQRMSRSVFRSRLEYQTIQDRFWCSVIPRGHADYVSFFKIS
jgi:hypothetical protein